jgi:holliday junction DNA helicase RuvA
MIAFLRGKLFDNNTDFIILDVQGVGYKVGISRTTLQDLPEIGKEVGLLIHHHITESAQSLYGFLRREEQALFEELITVKSIGPKLALGILSGMNAADLMDAIVRQDVLRLSGVPGIGKKTAERIVLELRDRVNKKRDGISLPAGLPGSTLAREAIAALEALGYRRNSVESTISAIMRAENPPDNVSDLIKRALKEMQ